MSVIIITTVKGFQRFPTNTGSEGISKGVVIFPYRGQDWEMTGKQVINRIISKTKHLCIIVPVAKLLTTVSVFPAQTHKSRGK